MRVCFYWSLILFCLSVSANEKPQRIVSLTLCTDQVLLMLVDKERIASISYLTQDPAYSYMWKSAKDLPVHHGSAEEIIPLNPDLIIGPEFSTNNTVQIMRHLGHKVTTLAAPTTLKEAENFTRHLGNLVGEQTRAEEIIKNMRADITKAKMLVAQLPKKLAISYGPNGFTAGRHTIKNEIIETSGYRNLAAELGIEYFGNISLEQLVWSNPDTIIIDEDAPNQNSIAQGMTTHPVLKQFLGEQRFARMPTNYWLCPGPIAGKAILALAEQRIK